MALGSSRLVARVSCVAAGVSITWFAFSAPPAPDYARDIRPILAKSCYGCHGPKAQMGGLRLDTKATALTGGQSGKVILPGDASGSILFKRISGIGDQGRRKSTRLNSRHIHLYR